MLEESDSMTALHKNNRQHHSRPKESHMRSKPVMHAVTVEERNRLQSPNFMMISDTQDHNESRLSTRLGS
jgi:hypothetical protein